MQHFLIANFNPGFIYVEAYKGLSSQIRADALNRRAARFITELDLYLIDQQRQVHDSSVHGAIPVHNHLFMGRP